MVYKPNIDGDGILHLQKYYMETFFLACHNHCYYQIVRFNSATFCPGNRQNNVLQTTYSTLCNRATSVCLFQSIYYEIHKKQANLTNSNVTFDSSIEKGDKAI